jgi:hypothetical protein
MQKVFRGFCFDEGTVTGTVYGDMFGGILAPVLEEEGPVSLCCSHMEYLHFHKEMRDFVNCRLSEKWVGGARLVTHPFCLPDLTAYDFSF